MGMYDHINMIAQTNTQNSPFESIDNPKTHIYW